MRIYELNRGDRFTLPECPEMPPVTFDHMDGMYCYALSDDGQVVNIAGYAECVRVGES